MKRVRHPLIAVLRPFALRLLARCGAALAHQSSPVDWFHERFVRLFYHRQLRFSRNLTPQSWQELADLYPLLLSWRPCLDEGAEGFDWIESSRQRKLLGSYYTPDSLTDCLLDSTLGPLLEEASAAADPAAALLEITICDPACGSGRLLLAAGRRLAARLAEVASLTPQDALDAVIGRCLFGVDIDAVAVTLCRAGLALAMSPRARAAVSLDCMVRQGDSLRGGVTGRFRVVLTNPPWGRLKAQAPEQFAAQARSVRRSGRFALSARGDLNSYALFAELARDLITADGRAGLIVPSGLATQTSTQPLFEDFLQKRQLVSWYDFSNRRGLFPGVQGNVKFALLTLSARAQPTFTAAAQLEHPDELRSPNRTYELTQEHLARLNPQTHHCPPARSGRELCLLTRLHERFPVLGDEAGPWGLRLGTMFHMTHDAPQFRRREWLDAAEGKWHGNRCEIDGRCYWPLYEGKLIGQYDHRRATFEGVPEGRRYGIHAAARLLPADANRDVIPRYWVAADLARARGAGPGRLLAVRNALSAVADARSLVAVLLPPCVAVGNSLVLARTRTEAETLLLLGLFNSFILDHLVRQKAAGSNLNFHILRQLPVPPPEFFRHPCPWAPMETLGDWLGRRVRQLSETTETEQRFRLRCEIDAACFRLYGLSATEAEEVFDAFPAVHRREQGQPRTRTLVVDLLRQGQELTSPRLF